jgi:hypothetical protein
MFRHFKNKSNMRWISGVFLLLLSASIFFAGTMDRWHGINLTQKSDTVRLREKITELIAPGAKINEIVFFRASGIGLTNIAGSANIFYAGANAGALEIIDLASWNITHGKKTAGRFPAGGAAVSEIDFTMIPAVLEQAIRALEDENLEYKGISELRVMPGPAKTEYEFTLFGKSPDYGAWRKFKLKKFYYCRELKFAVSADGNVTLQKIGEFEWVR